MVGPKSSGRQRLNSLLFHLLVIAAASLVAVLSVRHDRHWDWTASQRNSLSSASRELLLALEAAPRLTAYVREDRLLRQQVSDLVARYQQVRADIDLTFVDPDRHPELARQLGVSMPVEIEVDYEGRREKIESTSEEALTNAIQRVASREVSWIVALDGHGERDLLGHANHDLGQFGAELERKGFQTQSLNLAKTPQIPDNTGVLLIAGPSVDLLDAELRLIRNYTGRGGNLMLLGDPGTQSHLAPLLEYLGVRLLPGVVVDANVRALGIDDPSFALVSDYPEHPATAGLDAISLYPQAAALETNSRHDWSVQPLLTTLAGSWNETGPIRGQVQRDPKLDEHAGPLNLGLALSREVPVGSEGGRREQRVVVIGDGDFISNAYLGNGGNLDVGLRLARWVAHQDRWLHIPPRTTSDRNLELSRWQAGTIGIGFLFALPLLLVVGGFLVWWRRKV